MSGTESVSEVVAFALVALLIIVIVGVLYLARAFFLPITMAFIVGTMLSPAAGRLERGRRTEPCDGVMPPRADCAGVAPPAAARAPGVASAIRLGVAATDGLGGGVRRRRAAQQLRRPLPIELRPWRVGGRQ